MPGRNRADCCGIDISASRVVRTLGTGIRLGWLATAGKGFAISWPVARRSMRSSRQVNCIGIGITGRNQAQPIGPRVRAVESAQDGKFMIRYSAPVSGGSTAVSADCKATPHPGWVNRLRSGSAPWVATEPGIQSKQAQVTGVVWSAPTVADRDDFGATTNRSPCCWVRPMLHSLMRFVCAGGAGPAAGLPAGT